MVKCIRFSQKSEYSVHALVASKLHHTLLLLLNSKTGLDFQEQKDTDIKICHLTNIPMGLPSEHSSLLEQYVDSNPRSVHTRK